MRESAHKGRGKTDSTEKEVKRNMKESSYRSYDELPLFLNAATVAKVLGVSPSSGYELMHEPDFPVLKVGSRLVVPKEKFVEWVSQHTQGGAE
jgi:predicted DNA-binding transcriptional regulator AlpA